MVVEIKLLIVLLVKLFIMFLKNENVIYVVIKKAIIEEVHYDDAPNLYYTIKILNTQKINQTVEKI